MEASGGGGGGRRFGLRFSAADILVPPLVALLERSGALSQTPSHPDPAASMPPPAVVPLSASTDGADEFSIRIIGPGDEDHPTASTAPTHGGDREWYSSSSPQRSEVAAESTDTEAYEGSESSSHRSYDPQSPSRESFVRTLPFMLLLLLVFIRQHLQGFFVTVWIVAVKFKSDVVLRKQTALKGERKISVLVGIILVFLLHVFGVYWWCRYDSLLYPLVFLPPEEIPSFWHAVFICTVNDTMVRQTAMVFKCVVLMFYKNSKGCSYRKQGRMLTLVEYFLLLYCALLPAPVWYRFFLNKEYGSIFSSLTTGLYLIFKLTSVVQKVRSVFVALKAFTQKEIPYGSYATIEEVMEAGDLCAICQEKMHSPILLQCKHIFCEDCVSEWFERDRTCPLCRRVVNPVSLQSFADGSTSMLFQLF